VSQKQNKKLRTIVLYIKNIIIFGKDYSLE